MGLHPVTDRGRESLARIVAAASELFHQRGVAATGLSDVATASGTGKGQLYHYFDSKNELVKAVIDQQVQQTIDAQRPLLARMSHAEDLRTWTDAAVDSHVGSTVARCPLGALVNDVAHDAELRSHLHRGFGQWSTVLSEALERLQAQGIARRDRTSTEQADLLLMAYEGGLVLAAARGTLAPLRASLDAALDVILEPLTPRARR